MTTVNAPAIPTPSGYQYLLYCYPKDDTTQAPVFMSKATNSDDLDGYSQWSTNQTTADVLIVTTVDSDPVIRSISSATTYEWTGDTLPPHGVNIQSTSNLLAAGENYLFIPASQLAEKTETEWYKIEPSDPYKSTFYLESVFPTPDGSPICWRDGFRLKYMWDSTSVGNCWYFWFQPLFGLLGSFKATDSSPPQIMNPTLGAAGGASIFYLLPVNLPLQACSGTIAGQCSIYGNLTFDPFNASGEWGFYNPGSSGCVLSYDSLPVVSDGSSAGLSSCTNCPVGNAPPSSSGPNSGGIPTSNGPPTSLGPAPPAPPFYKTFYFELVVAIAGALLVVLLMWAYLKKRGTVATTNP